MSPQASIAHYRIVSKLGEGGMGAVYRATDTKLNREVAIKVLPEAFAADPDRMARFLREAQVLASLNHPNIGAIYGVEERALVLELVEGAEPRGPLLEAETLSILHQLIDALEYAHEHGVIHRDLKPANLKLTPDGRLKVLDFGLAKAISGEAAASDPASSPTLTMRATMAGVIMGTAAYMSPEQARGHEVDKRADIWAFGAVVYELLTGRQLFHGETVSDTLAAVLRDEPDLSQVPPRFQRFLRLCLTRDPRRRLRDISGARLLLEEPPPAAAPAPAARRSRLGWVVAALGLVVIVLAAFLWRERAGAGAGLKPMMRFDADLGPQARRSSPVAAILSPDGSSMVFFAGEAYPRQQLAIRRLNQAQVSLLPGTAGAQDPFFSPDGQWIGFFADEKLQKISTQGGSPITICATNLSGRTPRGSWWGEDGTIVATLDSTRLFRVSASGGKPQLLGKPKDHGDIVWAWPQILPDRDTVLFTAPSERGRSAFENARIESLSLRTGKTKVVHTGGYFARYLPSGHLVYMHDGTLFAVRFDPARLEIEGTPVPLLEDIADIPATGAGEFDFTPNGVFVYLAGTSLDYGRPAVWTDATGHVEPLVAPPAGVVTPRFSPDGKLLALMTGRYNLAVYDLARDTLTRLAIGGGAHPAWMPDSKHLIYTSPAGLFSIRADGSGQPQKLLDAGKDPLSLPFPTSVSPDGRWLAYYQMSAATGFDLWMLPLDPSDPEHLKAGSPQPFVQEPGHETHPMFSPDGRFVAYTSTQEGQSPQVFVRPAPGPTKSGAGGKWQISVNGGRFPTWSRSGRNLFFLGPDFHIMTLTYSTQGEVFNPGKPHEWSPTQVWFPGTQWDFDISPDGKRAAILALPVKEATSSTVHITVLLNFFDELKRRLP